jgi:hypothetical protein
MPFVLYLDALGMQEHYNQDTRRAQGILKRMISVAKSAFKSTLPYVGGSLLDQKNTGMVLMNDSVFVYSNDIKHLLYFIDKFCRQMFVPVRNTFGIAFRGAIAKTANIPKILSDTEERITTTTLTVDNITAALIADKKHVIGGRILVDKKLIEPHIIASWPVRYQAMLLDVTNYREGLQSDLFKEHLEGYYDVAWMTAGTESGEKAMIRSIYKYWQYAAHNERSALHASCLQLLYRACVYRRNGVLNVLYLLSNGMATDGLLENKPQKSVGHYREWLVYADYMDTLRDNKIEILP